MSERQDGVPPVEGPASAACWDALASMRDDAVRALRRRGIDEAEDHVHEAMVRLGQRPLEHASDAQLRALLTRVAWHIAIDRHRRRGRLRRLLPRLLDPNVPSTAEEIIAERSEARWLAAGLAKLGGLERAALMEAVAGHGVEEIAVVLGVDYKAAENALGRARRKLRMRAAAVTVGVAALLRRLRLEDQSAALGASALAAALLLLGPGARPAVAAAPPRAGAVVVNPSPAGAVSAAPAQRPALSASASRLMAAPGNAVTPRARTALAATTPPQPPPPAPLIQPPWQGSPGVILGGRVRVTVPGGTPAGWALSCAVEATRSATSVVDGYC
jgi:RNA polymerase sigma factor (sigma-70 family)